MNPLVHKGLMYRLHRGKLKFQLKNLANSGLTLDYLRTQLGPWTLFLNECFEIKGNFEESKQMTREA